MTCITKVLVKDAVLRAQCLVLTFLSPAHFDYTPLRTRTHEANNLASMASYEKQMLTGEQEKRASGFMGQ